MRPQGRISARRGLPSYPAGSCALRPATKRRSWSARNCSGTAPTARSRAAEAGQRAGFGTRSVARLDKRSRVISYDRSIVGDRLAARGIRRCFPGWTRSNPSLWQEVLVVMAETAPFGSIPEGQRFRVHRIAAPLRHSVTESIRNAIAAGVFKAGARLPERDLCAMTGVSRTLVREALRQLESEGLINVVAHRGPVVSRVTPEQAEGIYQVRIELEGLASQLFAERASEVQRLALTEGLRGGEKVLRLRRSDRPPQRQEPVLRVPDRGLRQRGARDHAADAELEGDAASRHLAAGARADEREPGGAAGTDGCAPGG